MALQQQLTQPSQLVGQLGQDYATQLTGLTSVPLDTSKFAPQLQVKIHYKHRQRLLQVRELELMHLI